MNLQYMYVLVYVVQFNNVIEFLYLKDKDKDC